MSKIIDELNGGVVMEQTNTSEVTVFAHIPGADSTEKISLLSSRHGSVLVDSWLGQSVMKKTGVGMFVFSVLLPKLKYTTLILQRSVSPRNEMRESTVIGSNTTSSASSFNVPIRSDGDVLGEGDAAVTPSTAVTAKDESQTVTREFAGRSFSAYDASCIVFITWNSSNKRVFKLDATRPGSLFVGKYPMKRFPSGTYFGIRASSTRWANDSQSSFSFEFPEGYCWTWFPTSERSSKQLWTQYKMVACIEDRTFDRRIVFWENPPFMNRLIQPINDEDTLLFQIQTVIYAEWSDEYEETVAIRTDLEALLVPTFITMKQSAVSKTSTPLPAHTGDTHPTSSNAKCSEEVKSEIDDDYRSSPTTMTPKPVDKKVDLCIGQSHDITTSVPAIFSHSTAVRWPSYDNYPHYASEPSLAASLCESHEAQTSGLQSTTQRFAETSTTATVQTAKSTDSSDFIRRWSGVSEGLDTLAHCHIGNKEDITQSDDHIEEKNSDWEIEKVDGTIKLTNNEKVSFEGKEVVEKTSDEQLKENESRFDEEEEDNVVYFDSYPEVDNSWEASDAGKRHVISADHQGLIVNISDDENIDADGPDACSDIDQPTGREVRMGDREPNGNYFQERLRATSPFLITGRTLSYERLSPARVYSSLESVAEEEEDIEERVEITCEKEAESIGSTATDNGKIKQWVDANNNVVTKQELAMETKLEHEELSMEELLSQFIVTMRTTDLEQSSATAVDLKIINTDKLQISEDKLAPISSDTTACEFEDNFQSCSEQVTVSSASQDATFRVEDNCAINSTEEDSASVHSRVDCSWRTPCNKSYDSSQASSVFDSDSATSISDTEEPSYQTNSPYFDNNKQSHSSAHKAVDVTCPTVALLTASKANHAPDDEADIFVKQAGLSEIAELDQQVNEESLAGAIVPANIEETISSTDLHKLQDLALIAKVDRPALEATPYDAEKFVVLDNNTIAEQSKDVNNSHTAMCDPFNKLFAKEMPPEIHCPDFEHDGLILPIESTTQNDLVPSQLSTNEYIQGDHPTRLEKLHVERCNDAELEKMIPTACMNQTVERSWSSVMEELITLQGLTSEFELAVEQEFARLKMLEKLYAEANLDAGVKLGAERYDAASSQQSQQLDQFVDKERMASLELEVAHELAAQAEIAALSNLHAGSLLVAEKKRHYQIEPAADNQLAEQSDLTSLNNAHNVLSTALSATRNEQKALDHLSNKFELNVQNAQGTPNGQAIECGAHEVPVVQTELSVVNVRHAQPAEHVLLNGLEGLSVLEKCRTFAELGEPVSSDEFNAPYLKFENDSTSTRATDVMSSALVLSGLNSSDGIKLFESAETYLSVESDGGAALPEVTSEKNASGDNRKIPGTAEFVNHDSIEQRAETSDSHMAHNDEEEMSYSDSCSSNDPPTNMSSDTETDFRLACEMRLKHLQLSDCKIPLDSLLQRSKDRAETLAYTTKERSHEQRCLLEEFPIKNIEETDPCTDPTRDILSHLTEPEDISSSEFHTGINVTEEDWSTSQTDDEKDVIDNLQQDDLAQHSENCESTDNGERNETAPEGLVRKMGESTEKKTSSKISMPTSEMMKVQHLDVNVNEPDERFSEEGQNDTAAGKVIAQPEDSINIADGLSGDPTKLITEESSAHKEIKIPNLENADKCCNVITAEEVILVKDDAHENESLAAVENITTDHVYSNAADGSLERTRENITMLEKEEIGYKNICDWSCTDTEAMGIRLPCTPSIEMTESRIEGKTGLECNWKFKNVKILDQQENELNATVMLLLDKNEITAGEKSGYENINTKPVTAIEIEPTASDFSNEEEKSVLMIKSAEILSENETKATVADTEIYIKSVEMLTAADDHQKTVEDENVTNIEPDLVDAVLLIPITAELKSDAISSEGVLDINLDAANAHKNEPTDTAPLTEQNMLSNLTSSHKQESKEEKLTPTLSSKNDSEMEAEDRPTLYNLNDDKKPAFTTTAPLTKEASCYKLHVLSNELNEHDGVLKKTVNLVANEESTEPVGFSASDSSENGMCSLNVAESNPNAMSAEDQTPLKTTSASTLSSFIAESSNDTTTLNEDLFSPGKNLIRNISVEKYKSDEASVELIPASNNNLFPNVEQIGTVLLQSLIKMTSLSNDSLSCASSDAGFLIAQEKLESCTRNDSECFDLKLQVKLKNELMQLKTNDNESGANAPQEKLDKSNEQKLQIVEINEKEMKKLEADVNEEPSTNDAASVHNRFEIVDEDLGNIDEENVRGTEADWIADVDVFIPSPMLNSTGDYVIQLGEKNVNQIPYDECKLLINDDTSAENTDNQPLGNKPLSSSDIAEACIKPPIIIITVDDSAEFTIENNQTADTREAAKSNNSGFFASRRNVICHDWVDTDKQPNGNVCVTSTANAAAGQDLTAMLETLNKSCDSNEEDDDSSDDSAEIDDWLHAREIAAASSVHYLVGFSEVVDQVDSDFTDCVIIRSSSASVSATEVASSPSCTNVLNEISETVAQDSDFYRDLLQRQAEFCKKEDIGVFLWDEVKSTLDGNNNTEASEFDFKGDMKLEDVTDEALIIDAKDTVHLENVIYIPPSAEVKDIATTDDVKDTASLDCVKKTALLDEVKDMAARDDVRKTSTLDDFEIEVTLDEVKDGGIFCNVRDRAIQFDECNDEVTPKHIRHDPMLNEERVQHFCNKQSVIVDANEKCESSTVVDSNAPLNAANHKIKLDENIEAVKLGESQDEEYHEIFPYEMTLASDKAETSDSAREETSSQQQSQSVSAPNKVQVDEIYYDAIADEEDNSIETAEASAAAASVNWLLVDSDEDLSASDGTALSGRLILQAEHASVYWSNSNADFVVPNENIRVHEIESPGPDVDKDNAETTTAVTKSESKHVDDCYNHFV